MKKENIGVIGIGKLGLSLALNFEKIGYKVWGCDIRQSYVKSLASKKYSTIEPSIDELLASSECFFPTTSLKETVENCNILYITVRTETEPDGSYDVSQAENVVESLLSLGFQNTPKTLIINCNVNPGYTNSVHERLAAYNYKTSFNPEWVAQGTIVINQTNPDVVVIGEYDAEEGEKILSLYSHLCKNKPAIYRMDCLSAEITKVSLNCFLTTKITFANMVGDIANKVGADSKKILEAIGSDSRIGGKYFSYGYGYGGPCFPRDNRAMIKYAQDNKIEPLLPIATQSYNSKHLEYQVEFDKSKFAHDEKVYIDGVSYKPGVDILEESQQLLYAKTLADEGYSVVIRDLPSVCSQVRKLYGDLFELEYK